MDMEEKDDFLVHYGTPRHSGRYPWGSGKKPQRSKDFLGRADELKKQGLTEREIVEGLGLESTTELRALRKIAKNDMKAYQTHLAQKLRDKGMSNVAIGKRLGIGESQVRSLLSEDKKAKTDVLGNTADILRETLKNSKYVDVGTGVGRYLGVSDQTLSTAVKMLEQEGYELKRFDIRQVTTGNITPGKALVPEGTTNKEFYSELDQVNMPSGYISGYNGDTNYIHRPVQFSRDRVMVRYDTGDENSGALKDGVIEVRRGVPELDMGNSRYAQVRIAMDNGMFMKGMAVYNDHMPDGVDVIFNSNKKEGSPDEKVFKPQKSDPDNPFGSSVTRQNDWTDAEGNKHEGALNILREEGAWQDWKKAIAAQVLSKQPIELARKQLSLASSEKKEEYEELMSLTNPVVKKKLLEEFADDCDKSAVDLKAVAFPRQSSHVILPINSLRDNEVFAPKYDEGEEVVLIRYPHGGIFEIPRLRVNNRNKEAKEVIGTDAADAVGINSKVAEQLSGADFDGDSVLVIPTRGQNIKTAAPLEQLKNFDPKKEYAYHEGMKVMTEKQKGIQMGIVTNLITDMTLQEAPFDEIARAVKHSMVVIDAYKHKLDYTQSYEDNGISELQAKYQNGPRGGASTLVSKAGSRAYVDERDRRYSIDPETGEKIWKYTGAKKVQVKKDSEGNKIFIQTDKPKQQESTKMYEAKDAYELSSGHPMDDLYAAYANSLKALGNQARKASLSVGKQEYSPTAYRTYKSEVDSLNNKLDIALRNAPLERKAQMVANTEIKAKIQSNPELADDDHADDLKKVRAQTLNNARIRFGAHKESIKITDKEWEAIQAGAVTSNKLENILNNADPETVRKLATPRTQITMTPAKIASARAMLNAGFTIKEVADRYGVSASTITSYVKE